MKEDAVNLSPIKEFIDQLETFFPDNVSANQAFGLYDRCEEALAYINQITYLKKYPPIIMTKLEYIEFELNDIKRFIEENDETGLFDSAERVLQTIKELEQLLKGESSRWRGYPRRPLTPPDVRITYHGGF